MTVKIELLDLPMFWTGRAKALRLLHAEQKHPVDATLRAAETYENCADELRAALATPHSGQTSEQFAKNANFSPELSGQRGAEELAAAAQSLDRIFQVRGARRETYSIGIGTDRLFVYAMCPETGWHLPKPSKVSDFPVEWHWDIGPIIAASCDPSPGGNSDTEAGA